MLPGHSRSHRGMAGGVAQGPTQEGRPPWRSGAEHRLHRGRGGQSVFGVCTRFWNLGRPRGGQAQRRGMCFWARCHVAAPLMLGAGGPEPAPTAHRAAAWGQQRKDPACEECRGLCRGPVRAPCPGGMTGRPPAQLPARTPREGGVLDAEAPSVPSARVCTCMWAYTDVRVCV